MFMIVGILKNLKLFICIKVITFLFINSCSINDLGEIGNDPSHWDERSVKGEKVKLKISAAMEKGFYLRQLIRCSTSSSSNCIENISSNTVINYLPLSSKINNRSYYFIDSVKECEKKIINGSIFTEPILVALSCSLVERKTFGQTKKSNFNPID